MITEAQRRALFALREALHLCEEAEVHSLMTLPVFAAEVQTVLDTNPETSGSAVDKNCYWCGGSGIRSPEQGVCFGGDRCKFCGSADALGLTL